MAKKIFPRGWLFRKQNLMTKCSYIKWELFFPRFFVASFYKHKRSVPTLAFLQLTKPTVTKSNHTKTLVSESRDFKFLRLERGNERKRKKGRRKENPAAGSLGD